MFTREWQGGSKKTKLYRLKPEAAAETCNTHMHMQVGDVYLELAWPKCLGSLLFRYFYKAGLVSAQLAGRSPPSRREKMG